MRNLAGHPNPDPIVSHELARARIPVFLLPEAHTGEVRTSVVGELGPLKFRRHGGTGWSPVPCPWISPGNSTPTPSV